MPTLQSPKGYFGYFALRETRQGNPGHACAFPHGHWRLKGL